MVSNVPIAIHTLRKGRNKEARYLDRRIAFTTHRNCRHACRSDPLSNTTALVHHVMDSPNPHETFADLQNNEKSRFVEAVRPEVSETIPLDNELFVTLAGGCHTKGHHQDWNSNYGFTVATSWLDIHWCEDGRKVTGVSITNKGGETRTPGYKYEGVLNSAADKKGAWGGAFSEVGFSLFGGGDGNAIPTLNPCIKISGTIGGRSQVVADSTSGNNCRRLPV